MDSIPVHIAKSHFSEILRRVEAGETVIVTRHKKGVAEIKPMGSGPGLPTLGAFEGEFPIPESAFAPLSEEELKDWYGE
jgi:prevent-host-death family protein